MEYTIKIYRVETFRLEAASEGAAQDVALVWSTLEDQDADLGDSNVFEHSHDIINIEVVVTGQGLETERITSQIVEVSHLVQTARSLQHKGALSLSLTHCKMAMAEAQALVSMIQAQVINCGQE